MYKLFKTLLIMKKLKLKHLSCYLPYGVIVYDAPIVNLPYPYINTRTSLKIRHIDDLLSGKRILALRPLSDLTKEFDINSEKFIPIVGLAKIAFFKNGHHDLNGNYVDLSGGYTFHFSNNSDGVCFSCKRGYDGNKWDYDCFVPNQLGLFQKLFEWHFDIYGLIKKGLAVDINTIK